MHKAGKMLCKIFGHKKTYIKRIFGGGKMQLHPSHCPRCGANLISGVAYSVLKLKAERTENER